MVARDDKKYIQMACELAEKARGKTSPNPLVGSVILKKGKIVGKGYHRQAGTPHAEVNALRSAGSDANGATLYVNLEPCCHQGKTGPCTEAIIKAGIKRVVFAIKDPNPEVNGKGARCLRKAGIEVKYGILKKTAEKLNEVYIKHIKTGLPFITLKMAQTMDGRIATATGDSKWISGFKSRQFAHRLRAEHDAVLVGGGTVQTDNPELTVRHVKGRNPYRIIVSRNLKISDKLKLFKNNNDAKTILATSPSNASRLIAGKNKIKNLIVWSVTERNGKLLLDDLLIKASQFGLASILIEGGSRLATSFMKADLIDKYCFCIAPKIIGTGVNSVGSLNKKLIAEAIEFEELTYDLSYEPDVMIIGYPKKSKGKRSK